MAELSHLDQLEAEAPSRTGFDKAFENSE